MRVLVGAQVLFIALKSDEYITWVWTQVFLVTWIFLSLAFGVTLTLTIASTMRTIHAVISRVFQAEPIFSSECKLVIFV